MSAVLRTVAATPAPKPRPKPKLKLKAAETRTIGQAIAAVAAGFLPIASYCMAHMEVADRPLMWALVAAGLAFSAPTLAEWAEKWCRGKYKAYGPTSLAGLAILVAINCNSAWRLAGKKV